MDPDKIVQFFTQYAAEWSQTTIATLISPTIRFQPTHVGDGGLGGISSGKKTKHKAWLNPRLLVYAIFSIVLGLLINSLIPGREKVPDLLTAVIVIFVYWLFAGSLLHLACRLLRGRGTYVDTLSVLFQVFATLYVSTSFLTLLGTLFLVFPPTAGMVEKIPVLGRLFVDSPPLLFFMISAALNLIYVPLAMKAVHAFGWGKTLIVGALPPVFVGIAYVIFEVLGFFMMGAPPQFP